MSETLRLPSLADLRQSNDALEAELRARGVDVDSPDAVRRLQDEVVALGEEIARLGEGRLLDGPPADPAPGGHDQGPRLGTTAGEAHPLPQPEDPTPAEPRPGTSSYVERLWGSSTGSPVKGPPGEAGATSSGSSPKGPPPAETDGKLGMTSEEMGRRAIEEGRKSMEAAERSYKDMVQLAERMVWLAQQAALLAEIDRLKQEVERLKLDKAKRPDPNADEPGGVVDGPLPGTDRPPVAPDPLGDPRTEPDGGEGSGVLRAHDQAVDPSPADDGDGEGGARRTIQTTADAATDPPRDTVARRRRGWTMLDVIAAVVVFALAAGATLMIAPELGDPIGQRR